MPVSTRFVTPQCWCRPVEAISACEKVAVWDRALSLLKRSCCNDIYGFSAAASACGNVAGCSNFLVHFFPPAVVEYLQNIGQVEGKDSARQLNLSFAQNRVEVFNGDLPSSC